MRRAISLAVLGTIVLVAMALAGASSAARPQVGLVGAPTGASSKVRAIGPGFVRQVGLRNYAGPNCPGAGWNCTSSTRVLQAASPGGQNVAECTGSAVMNPCVIVQNNAQNTARCTQKSTAASAAQSCKITQTGASNIAFVTQTISQSDGSTQYGTQAAEVTQTGSALNQVQLIQDASQNIKTGTIQLQNVYQSAVVTQTASGSGNNTSSIYQSQLQKEYAKSTSQKQNDGTDPITDCFAGSPLHPNACANVTQVAAGGTNDNHLKQFVSEDQNSTGPATQVQGANEGGLDGRVHQETDNPGHSNNDVNQNKALKQTVPKGGGSNQTQIDPVRCCGTFSQLGGTGNTETINQASSLSASQPGATQTSTIIGESRTPDGTCIVTQKASINGDSDTNGATHSPCPLLIVETACNVDGCTAETPVFGEVISSLDKTVRNDTRLESEFADSTDATTDDTVEFKITYSNVGTVDAHSVTVTDVLPPTMGFAGPDECTPACSFDGDTNTLRWDLGTVAPDESVDLFFFADTSEASSGTITNTASVLTKEEGPGADSDSASVVVPIPPASSLSLLVRNLTDGGTFGTTATADPTDTLEYQLVYSNSGGPAHNVTTDGFGVLPTNSSLVNGIDLGGGNFTSFLCPGPLSSATCALGLAPNYDVVASDTPLSARTVRFTVSPTTFCTTLSFTATGTTDEENSFQSNSTTVGVTGCPG